MATDCLHRNITWYHRPAEGKLTKQQFQFLKAALLSNYRFWLRSYHTQVYWSRRYKAVAIRYRRGMMNYQHIKERIHDYIHGYFKALEYEETKN